MSELSSMQSRELNDTESPSFLLVLLVCGWLRAFQALSSLDNPSHTKRAYRRHFDIFDLMRFVALHSALHGISA